MAPTLLTPLPAPADTAIAADEEAASVRTGRGGRPSRIEALRLRERILEVAVELFLKEGYGSTTIEAVAARAGISKRTLYHRFDDKAALFAAVVHRIIEQLRPPREVPLLEGATVHEVLRRLAGLILHAALSPPALALHRLVTAEVARFPELAHAVSREGTTLELTALIAELLAREASTAGLSPAARSFAAQQFLQMVIGIPQRRAVGVDSAMSPGELEVWADSVVNLFLNGCRGWSG
jgi:AcrR family transcriptional regulator